MEGFRGLVGGHWWRVSVVSVRCGCVPRLRCRALLARFRFCFAWRVLLALLARVRTCGAEEHGDDMVRTKTSTHPPAKQSEDDRKHRSRHPAAGATPHLLRILDGVCKLLPQRAGHRLRDTVLGQPYLRQVRLQSFVVALNNKKIVSLLHSIANSVVPALSWLYCRCAGKTYSLHAAPCAALWRCSRSGSRTRGVPPSLPG